MEPSEEINLMALGVDCLERIFRYLPLDDLLNVADSNKQLKEVAEMAFVLNHWNTNLTISGNHPFKRPGFWTCSNHTVSMNLKIILQVLRCFGHLILKLHIGSDEVLVTSLEFSNIHISHITSYIKLYCVESLTELNIRRKMPGGILNHFVDPFPNVRSAFVQSSDLTNLSLVELFPNMKCLTYRCDKITDFASIESNVPALNHLEIVPRIPKEGSELFRTIRLNPKLQILAIPFFAIYQGINEVLPHLTVLKMDIQWFHINNSVHYHFKTVKRLEIQHYVHFTQMPFSFDNLEELDLKFMYARLLKYHHEKFYDFINQHPSIIKLKIHGESIEINLLKLINMLPVVKEFDVNHAPYLTRDVIRFVNEKKTLKIMNVFFKKKDHSVIKLLNNKEWHLGKAYGTKLIFERK